MLYICVCVCVFCNLMIGLSVLFSLFYYRITTRIIVVAPHYDYDPYLSMLWQVLELTHVVVVLILRCRRHFF